jgi:hypothetical protein
MDPNTSNGTKSGPSSDIGSSASIPCEESPSTQSISFLSLPLELRLVIYNLILDDAISASHEPSPSNLTWSQRAIRDSTWCKSIISSHTHPLYPLLFVNQTTRLEVSAFLYASPSFTFTFISPRACLFFLYWTFPDIHLLRSLRIGIPRHDTYTLEPIFDILLEYHVPLERLAIELMDINSGFRVPPKDSMLPSDIGLEALRQAQLRATKTRALFGKELDPEMEFFPRLMKTPVQVAQCSFTSSLGQLTTLRYLEIEYRPAGYWANEFELAVLRLQARMFEMARSEGKKVVFWAPASNERHFWGINLEREPGDEVHACSRGIQSGKPWLDSKYGIEGTPPNLKGEGLWRIGVGCWEVYPKAPVVVKETKTDSIMRRLGWKQSSSGARVTVRDNALERW